MLLINMTEDNHGKGMVMCMDKWLCKGFVIYASLNVQKNRAIIFNRLINYLRLTPGCLTGDVLHQWFLHITSLSFLYVHGPQ